MREENSKIFTEKAKHDNNMKISADTKEYTFSIYNTLNHILRNALFMEWIK